MFGGRIEPNGLQVSVKQMAGINFTVGDGGTSGVCLALYPLVKLAEDVSPSQSSERGKFPGITLAHNTQSKSQVDSILGLAEKSGGKIEKPAQDASWGGYSGYFSDPDGYLWEVACADSWEFNADGSLVIE